MQQIGQLLSGRWENLGVDHINQGLVDETCAVLHNG